MPSAPGWILSPLKGERRAEQLHFWLIMHPPQREPRVGGVSPVLYFSILHRSLWGLWCRWPPAPPPQAACPSRAHLVRLHARGTASMNAGRGAACSVGRPACSSLQGGAVSLRPVPLGPLPTTTGHCLNRPSSRCSCTNGGSCAESGEGSTRMPASLPA